MMLFEIYIGLIIKLLSNFNLSKLSIILILIENNSHSNLVLIKLGIVKLYNTLETELGIL